MAHCVYRVNPGLTSGDSGVLMDQAGGGGVGAAWLWFCLEPLFESWALSDRPKQRLMGLLEAQSE